MNTPLIIFTAIMLAGCVFLLYFLYQLWQDSRKSSTGPRVEVRRLSIRSAPRGKLLRFYSTEELVNGRVSARKSRL
jgi:threonine/homoserine/homoserine lactone efflux protein